MLDIKNSRHTHIATVQMYLQIRKRVSELRGPAFVCWSAVDKKSVYWSPS